MAENPFTEHPCFENGSLVLLLGQSRSGKSSFVQSVLMESQHQFRSKIKQLIYVYQADDDNIKKLQKKFGKNGMFLKSIPGNLDELLIESHSVLVLDDMELILEKNKEIRDQVMKLALITCHHKKTHVFISMQSYNVFYKKSPLNSLLFQSTSLVLFRSINTVGSLKRFLNAFDFKLKNNCTLWDIFKTYVQEKKYNYLVMNMAPCLDQAQIYSQILFCDSRPLIIFHEES